VGGIFTFSVKHSILDEISAAASVLAQWQLVPRQARGEGILRK